MTHPLSALLFKGYRRKVLSLLLLHPHKKYHVREIARLTGTLAGTLHKELTGLAEAGVLLREARGNQLQYSANPDCPIYKELASILRKTSDVIDETAKFGTGIPGMVISDQDVLMIGNCLPVSKKLLQKITRRHHIKRLVLFGSAARKELDPKSDVDLMVEFEPGREPSIGGMVNIQDALSRLFGGRKVDLATTAILRNPYRRRAIEKDMEELYAA